MLGKILNNRYQIIRKLGGGTFGETYLTQDQWLDNDNLCVVKRLKPDIINPLTLRLFNTEAQVLTKLGNHDQIPGLLAHFQQNEEFYLVQEFIDGHDLTQEIKKDRRLGETEVIKLLEDILEILMFVHQHNVIHRDIKPANIMRQRKDGNIVLIDFGGVKQVKTQPSSTMLTPVVGTHGYMPDEQFKNNAQLCSDIYAVGIVAIQAITGLQPYQMPRDAKTLQLIWRDKAQVSNRLADVLDKMVQFHFSLRYQLASEALDAIKSLSATAAYWFDRGDGLVASKSYDEGVTAYDQAIKIQPDYYQAWYHRGLVLRTLKRYEATLASYNKVIEIKQDYHQAWYSRSLVLDELGRYDDAIASFDRAITIKPDYYHAWYSRGLILKKLGRNDAAIQSFAQAIKIKRDYPEAWTGQGLVLNKLYRYHDAIASFDQAIKIKRDYPEAWTGRGWALNNLERYSEALASFDQAIQIKQDEYGAWAGRGDVLNKLENYNEAVVSLDQAIQIKQDDLDVWYNRGVALYYLQKYKDSLASFDQVLAINPHHELAVKNRKLPAKKLRPS